MASAGRNPETRLRVRPEPCLGSFLMPSFSQPPRPLPALPGPGTLAPAPRLLHVPLWSRPSASLPCPDGWRSGLAPGGPPLPPSSRTFAARTSPSRSSPGPQAGPLAPTQYLGVLGPRGPSPSPSTGAGPAGAGAGRGRAELWRGVRRAVAAGWEKTGQHCIVRSWQKTLRLSGRRGGGRAGSAVSGAGAGAEQPSEGAVGCAWRSEVWAKKAEGAGVFLEGTLGSAGGDRGQQGSFPPLQCAGHRLPDASL